MHHLLDNDVFFAAIYGKHVFHPIPRKWLDQAKPEGWGVAAETYLAAVRLLMNPVVMKSGHLSATRALEAVETERPAAILAVWCWRSKDRRKPCSKRQPDPNR